MSVNYSVHPGTVVKCLLMSVGKSQKWFANKMTQSKILIKDIVNNKRSVAPEMALLFESVTGYPSIKPLNILGNMIRYKKRFFVIIFPKFTFKSHFLEKIYTKMYILFQKYFYDNLCFEYQSGRYVYYKINLDELNNA